MNVTRIDGRVVSGDGEGVAVVGTDGQHPDGPGVIDAAGPEEDLVVLAVAVGPGHRCGQRRGVTDPTGACRMLMIGLVVVDHRAGRHRAADRHVAGGGGDPGQGHRESLVGLDRRVTGDVDLDRAGCLARIEDELAVLRHEVGVVRGDVVDLVVDGYPIGHGRGQGDREAERGGARITFDGGGVLYRDRAAELVGADVTVRRRRPQEVSLVGCRTVRRGAGTGNARRPDRDRRGQAAVVGQTAEGEVRLGNQCESGRDTPGATDVAGGEVVRPGVGAT